MKFHTALFVRLFATVALMGFAAAMLLVHLPYNALFGGCIVLLLLTETYFFTRSRSRIYDKAILAMLHDDFSVDLSEEYRHGNYALLYRLYETQKHRRNEQTARESVFVSILDSIDSAAIILKSNGPDWEVFLMNRCFSKLFGVPMLRQWNRLSEKLPAFAQVLETNGFADFKTSAEIRINEGELQTFSIQASATQTYDDRYYVVLLDSIQKVIEKKEKMAWVNLMNVISHELMNSLTPIRSLSQSIGEMLHDQQPTAEDLQDVREGLATILNRSNHLQFFVENYRKLTMLPTPAKTPVDLNKLLRDCLAVMAPMLRQHDISIQNDARFVSAVMADAQQLEQVFINLVTNSIFAVHEKEDKRIFISSYMENNRVFIAIQDTGKGIEKQIRDKIFLPFFTTRKDGAGIGLTLSKNIIETHGGYLSYSPRDGRTEFVVCLLC